MLSQTSCIYPRRLIDNSYPSLLDRIHCSNIYDELPSPACASCMIRDHLIRYEIVEIFGWLRVHRTGTTLCDGRLETHYLLMQHWPISRMARAKHLRNLPANPSRTMHRSAGLTHSASQLITSQGGMALRNSFTGLLCCIIPSFGTHRSCQRADPGAFMSRASDGCHGSTSPLSTARGKTLDVRLP